MATEITVDLKQKQKSFIEELHKLIEPLAEKFEIAVNIDYDERGRWPRYAISLPAKFYAPGIKSYRVYEV